jgi:hypothetical protein
MNKIHLRYSIRKIIKEELNKSFIYEATTDGTIESLIDATKIATNMGVFDDALFNEMKDTMIQGVNGALKGQNIQLPNDKKVEFNGYMDALMGPLRRANNLSQFIGAMMNVAKTKDNILNRLNIKETINENRVINWLKTIKNKTTEWWNENKYEIAITIAEIFARMLVEFLFAILRALTKSETKKTNQWHVYTVKTPIKRDS